MLGGLIAGALKGAADGYSTYAKGELENQQKLDYQKQIMQMQEEMNLRVDEIKRDRDVRDIGRKGTAEAENKLATAPTLARAGVLEATTKIDAATEAGLPGKEAAYKGAQLEANAGNITREAEIKGEAEGAGQVKKTSTPGYLDSVSKETSAKESSGSKAQAGLANFQLTQLRAIADLRTQLSKLPADSPEREELTQRIQDLQYGASSKSYSDVVTAAEGYRKMADNLRRDADKITDNEAERKAMLTRASEYESQADYILRGAVGKRLPGTQQKPGVSGGTVGSSPYPEGTRLMKDGQRYVVKNGVPVLDTSK